MKAMVIAIIAMILASSAGNAQENAKIKVVTYDMSFEGTWEIVGDVDILPRKIVLIPLVDSVRDFFIWEGKNPNRMELKQNSLLPLEKIEGKRYACYGYLVKKFPVWIQMGYWGNDGSLRKSKKYRYVRNNHKFGCSDMLAGEGPRFFSCKKIREPYTRDYFIG